MLSIQIVVQRSLNKIKNLEYHFAVSNLKCKVARKDFFTHIVLSFFYWWSISVSLTPKEIILAQVHVCLFYVQN